MKNRNSKKGFTLVEIMIVVVIIGLLAAMAIPAFQKVRQNSRRSAMYNDARQLASAAQQYFLEYNTTQVSFTVGTDGTVGAPIRDYVKKVGSGYTFNGNITQDAAFTMTHAMLGAGISFNSEGQLY